MTGLPLKFDFEKVGRLDGRYLIREFAVSFILLGQRYSRRELFALDTGSPMTMLRWCAFEPPGGALLNDKGVKCVEVNGWGGKRYVHAIPDVHLADGQFSFTFPDAKIDRNLNGHSFSLLGTDFLKSFELSFSPAQGYALLTRSDDQEAAN